MATPRTASAHINAVRFCRANLISLCNPASNSDVCMVVGKSTKRAITPPHVRRISSRVAQASELSQMHVADLRGPQLCAQGSWLNCGLCRERGMLRTSITRSPRCTRRRFEKAFHVRMECPIVRTVDVQTF